MDIHDKIVTNEKNPYADIELLKHMVKVSEDCVQKLLPDNNRGYKLVVNKPPRTTTDHLHIKILVPPFKRNSSV